MGNVFPMLVLNFALSLVLVWVLMPKLIAFLHKISYNQTVSEYSLQQYKEKAKTPSSDETKMLLTSNAPMMPKIPNTRNIHQQRVPQ